MISHVIRPRAGIAVMALALVATSSAQIPKVVNFSPWKASTGTVMTIEGNNLGTVKSAFFNGVPATSITPISDWRFKATVPPGATTGKIKVVTNYGETTTTSNLIIDNGAGGGSGGGGTLTVSNFTPWSAVAGTEVTVQGTGFTNTATVKFAGLPAASVTYLSAGTLKAVVPLGAVTGKIAVTVGSSTYTTTTDLIISGTGGGSGGGGNDSGSAPAFINPPNITIPADAMTGHPRIWIRSQDLPLYRSWATLSNPKWISALKVGQTAKNHMDTNAIVDTGLANWGNVPTPYESYAQYFAFMSLIHPDASEREDYATRAYTCLMKVINEADKGQLANTPYREADFATYNRASWYGEGFPLTVDWIYHKFSATDKRKIRRVFLRWIQENLRANTTNFEHPKPYGVYNDPALIDSPLKVRWASNNYFANHARQVGLMSVAMDEQDDVPADATEPPAGTLRKFVGSAIQAWLYQVAQNEKTAGAGGASAEGLGYGRLTGRAYASLLLGLHTVGMDRPEFGEGATLFSSDYWVNQLPNAYAHMLSPAKVVQESWIGPSYLPIKFSDDPYYTNDNYINIFGPMLIHARLKGDVAQVSKLRWMIENLAPGNAAYQTYRTESCLSGANVSWPIHYFLATDPNTSATTDPRPSMGTEHWASGLGMLLSRTDWTPGASWFYSKASWNSIDHQFGDAGSFGFYRAGEWLTKPHLGYGPKIARSDYQNTLCIENSGSTTINFLVDALARGSQFAYNGTQDPMVQASWSTGYAYTDANLTATYNKPSIAATDVTHASRATLFLKPDAVVIYDRAKTSVANRYKRFWMNLPATASINGRSATVTTPAGQMYAIDSVLPAAAVLSTSPREALDGEPAQTDPMKFRLLIEDPSKPQDVRFLTVLQGGAKKALASFTQSSGTAFDGVRIGDLAVAFIKEHGASVGATTFVLPATTTKLILCGLTPGAGYQITTTSSNGSLTVVVAPGGSSLADSAGVLSIP